MTNKINLFSTDLFNQNSLKNMIIKNLTQQKHLLRNVIDEFKNVLIENNNNNNNNGIYIKCNLHKHMLKEQTVHNLKGVYLKVVYLNGFICDNC